MKLQLMPKVSTVQGSFEPPYLGIDIDDIDDDLHRFKQGDKLDNIVSEFNRAFKSYTEVSPSGNGLHIIVKGKIPGSRRRKGNIEMYDSGRFFTMTGKISVNTKTLPKCQNKYLKLFITNIYQITLLNIQLQITIKKIFTTFQKLMLSMKFTIQNKQSYSMT